MTNANPMQVQQYRIINSLKFIICNVLTHTHSSHSKFFNKLHYINILNMICMLKRSYDSTNFLIFLKQ